MNWPIMLLKYWKPPKRFEGERAYYVAVEKLESPNDVGVMSFLRMTQLAACTYRMDIAVNYGTIDVDFAAVVPLHGL